METTTYPYPCKFWARGRCKQGENCKFLHTPFTATTDTIGFTSSAPEYAPIRCRFFQTTGCIKGSACPYLHDVGSPFVYAKPPFWYSPCSMVPPPQFPYGTPVVDGYYYPPMPGAYAPFVPKPPPTLPTADPNHDVTQELRSLLGVPPTTENRHGKDPTSYDIDITSTQELRALLGLPGGASAQTNKDNIPQHEGSQGREIDNGTNS